VASEFAHEVIEALKPEALARVKGGPLRRFFLRSSNPTRGTLYGTGGRPVKVRLPERGRFRRASYMTAVGEVAEAFTAEQREAWRRFGTLPEGFWDDVERRAREWDSLH
jgi:hypothetical protein